MALTLKFIHVLFVISWMVGVFYLPRMIVHYKLALTQNEDTKRLAIMARKLANFSLIVGIIATITGLISAYYTYNFRPGWIHAKIMVVIILWVYFAVTMYFARGMGKNRVTGSVLFWRIYNELALVILIFILYLAVFKPF